MAPKRGGLGRGLDSLIRSRQTADAPVPEAETENAAEKKPAANKPAAKKPASKKPAAGTDKPAAKKSAAKAPAAKKPAEKAPAAKKSAEKAPAAKKAAAKTPAVKKAAENKPAGKKTAVKEPETVMNLDPVTVPEPVMERKPANTAGDSVILMKISAVEPNREQPRKEFDADKLAELADSIKQFGVIQPLLVQKRDDYYEIIAGERRWRAAKIAGLREIPVIVREYSEQEAVEISLIENIQREDLNPIEEAKAYVRLMDEFHLTQESIAGRVAKSRVTITNATRLLRLPEEVQQMLISGDISEGHARAVLALPSAEAQIEAAKKIAAAHLSVREAERLVKQLTAPVKRRKKENDPVNDLIYKDLEERLKSALGTKVRIVRKKKDKGTIEIEYYSVPELERILDLLGQGAVQEGKA